MVLQVYIYRRKWAWILGAGDNFDTLPFDAHMAMESFVMPPEAGAVLQNTMI